MKHPVAIVLAVITAGLIVSYAIQKATDAFYTDGQGNRLPYVNRTVEFSDMGPDQFTVPEQDRLRELNRDNWLNRRGDGTAEAVERKQDR